VACRAVTERVAHLRLMQHVKNHCSPAVCTFVFKNRARLPSLIDDIWRWETIDDVLTIAGESLMHGLRSAESKPCVCGNAWTRFASYIPKSNGVDIQALCRSVVQSLSFGRAPTTPVIAMAGRTGGEGKSFFLKGLIAVYGRSNIFFAPQHPAFPLLGLENAKLVLLYDFRFLGSVLPIATQCLWFDGSPLPIAQPQNVQGMTGHDVYSGNAPIFITTKKGDVEALERAGDGDASMLLRRLSVFSCATRVAKPPVQIANCASCFARFVCSHGC